jgi:hypothetical protein
LAESRSDHHYGIFLLMEGGEPLLKLFFKEKVERDKIKEELKKVLDELKVNRQKYEGTPDEMLHGWGKVADSRFGFWYVQSWWTSGHASEQRRPRRCSMPDTTSTPPRPRVRLLSQ